ncbi:hypothetical protein B1A_03130, partial [mine drainage metagenome]
AISAARHVISVLETDLKGHGHQTDSQPTPAPTAIPTPVPTPVAAPIDVAPPAANLLNTAIVQTCWQASRTTITPVCQQAAVAAINAARSAEPVPLPPLALPAGYYQMPAPEQLFVLINLERASRNLPAVGSMSVALDQQAVGLAQQNADPALGGPDNIVAGVWGGDYGPTAMVFDWLYNDGWDGVGTANGGCTSPTASGCWGHRSDLFTTQGGSGLVAGIGCSPSWSGRTDMESCTVEFASGSNYGASAYTWSAIEGSQVGN